MNLANLLTVGIASLTALAIALPNLKAQSPQPQPAVAQSPTAQQDVHREADLFEIAAYYLQPAAGNLEDSLSFGRGRDGRISGVSGEGEGLRGQLVELESLQQEKVRELGQVTGLERKNEPLQGSK